MSKLTNKKMPRLPVTKKTENLPKKITVDGTRKITFHGQKRNDSN